MTTDFGMIQFAKVADPDLASGYVTMIMQVKPLQNILS
jgi:hypothetical protein